MIFLGGAYFQPEKIRQRRQHVLTINSSCYSDSKIDLPNYEYPVVATSAGRYALFTRDCFREDHPGRQDYHLLYVKSGKLYYSIKNKQHCIQAGGILLYNPKEPQHYECFLADAPDIYWVYFTGNDVDNTLAGLALSPGGAFPGTISPEYDAVFDSIINELLYRKLHFMDVSSMLIQQLLFLISRNICTMTYISSRNDLILEKVVAIFNSNYQQKISITSIARELNYSSSWLSKTFTKHFGLSPKDYLTNLRIEKAKSLLLSTMSIKQVAELTGFPDQMYFSRVFTNREGMTPSQYRQKHLDTALVSTSEAEGTVIKRR